MNQQLSPTEAGALRAFAHKEAARLIEERIARKAELEREMEATWAQERELDALYNPQIAQLVERVNEARQQVVNLCEQIQALNMEMGGKKVAPSERRHQLRRELLEILTAEEAEQAQKTVAESERAQHA